MKKAKKTKTKKNFVIGVRFMEDARREYTYLVAREVRIGDELIVDNDRGISMVFVSRLGHHPDRPYEGELKYIHKKVVRL